MHGNAHVVGAFARDLHVVELVHEAALGCAARAHLLGQPEQVHRELFGGLDAARRAAAGAGLPLEVRVHPLEDLSGVLDRQAQDRAHDARRDVSAQLDHGIGRSALANGVDRLARELAHARLERGHGAGLERRVEVRAHGAVLRWIQARDVRRGRRLLGDEVRRGGAELRGEVALVLLERPDVREARHEPAVELLEIEQRRLVAQAPIDRIRVVEDRVAERVVVDHRIARDVTIGRSPGAKEEKRWAASTVRLR